MFCPKCGKSDQTKDTYCRQCGEFLPDLDNLERRRSQQTPAQQFTLSLTFNVMSAIASISMAIALFVVHISENDVHPVIYSAISLLTVISIWQTISFFNNLKLRKRFVRSGKDQEETGDLNQVAGPKTNELLPEPDMTDFVPASVTENTTKNLVKERRTDQS